VTKAKSVFPTDDSLLKNAASGHDGHYEKMDRTSAGLELDPRPNNHLICRAYARATPLEPDVKGKICGFVAFDIPSRRRDALSKEAAGFPSCLLEYTLFYLHSKWSLHKIWD